MIHTCLKIWMVKNIIITNTIIMRNKCVIMITNPRNNMIDLRKINIKDEIKLK